MGPYSVVRISLHKPSNKKVAMKIYKKYRLLDPNRCKSFKREIKFIEKMKYPNLIRFYEVIDTSMYVILVIEYVEGGSLHGYLKSKQNIETRRERRYLNRFEMELRIAIPGISPTDPSN